jgi:hypothetical protein
MSSSPSPPRSNPRYSRASLLDLRSKAAADVAQRVNLAGMADNLVLFEEPVVLPLRSRMPQAAAVLPAAHARRTSATARTNLGGIQGVLTTSMYSSSPVNGVLPASSPRRTIKLDALGEGQCRRLRHAKIR